MSMNKKTRSLINTKYESQRIYYQRREIKKKDKQIQELTNNWNELEEWIKNDKEKATVNFECGRCFNMFDILDKMKQIKEGNNVSDRN